MSRRSSGTSALVLAAVAGVVFGCGPGEMSASETQTAGGVSAAAATTVKARLAAPPVVVKIGQTFEVRARFAHELPARKDGSGADAEFSIGPSTTDHDPVKMKGSIGHCYRQTLYNDLGRRSLRRLRAGSQATLIINVHGQAPKIVRRVVLASDLDAAVPPGCRLSPNPGPG